MLDTMSHRKSLLLFTAFPLEDVRLLDGPFKHATELDRSDGGNRVFDILVDGAKLATERLQNNQPGKFYDQVYPFTESLNKGKSKITVKFQAHPGAWAGGIFGLRILKAETETNK